MPIHDWTRVDAGIFHAFHHSWISSISRALNTGLLPPTYYYALAEQLAADVGPDILILDAPANDSAEADLYATRAKAVVIRHTSDHRIIAAVEIVSPGNKNNRHGLRAFVEKAVELLRGGIHLLIVDLLPPGPRDPQGIHKAVTDSNFALPPDRPLTLAAYIGGPCPEAFVEPTAVGQPLADMPLFLAPDTYIPVPLETTYQSAWEAMPAYWRSVLERDRG